MADDDTKSLIRSCLISTKGTLSLRELKKDFQTLVGGTIPFREYGHRTLEEYLRSIPDVVKVDDSGPDIQLRYVPDASTAGIASLVQRQRGAKKRVPPRRPTSYIPRSGAGGYRKPGGFSAPRFNTQSQRTFNVRPGARSSGPRPSFQSNSGPRWQQPAPKPTSGWGAPKPADGLLPTPSPPKPTQPPAQPKQARQPTPPPPPPAPSARTEVDPAALEPQQAPPASAQAWWGEAPRQSRAPPLPTPAPAPVPQLPTANQAPRLPTPAPVVQEAAVSGPVEELRLYISQHGLPEPKMETVTFKPKKGRVASFYTTIVVGDISCQTYPAESPSAAVAEAMASQMVLEELRCRQKLQHSGLRDSPVTQDPQLTVTRIAQILESRPNGLWRDSLPQEYRNRFHERVPDDWEDAVYGSGTARFDRIGADKYILYPTIKVSGGGGEGDSARGSEAGSGGAGDSLVRMEMAALPEEDLFPVYVTWVLSGSQLAFRIIGESNTDLLDDLLTEMEVAVLDTHEPVTPIIGGVYMAKVDGTPHRVQVVDILDDMVSAFFVDIGDTELVAARSLAPLDVARFGRLPGQALHAQLSGVDPHRPGAREALTKLVLRKSLICQVVVADEGRLEVILFDTSGEDDININQTLREVAEADVPPTLPTVGGVVDAFVVHVAPTGDEVYVQLDSETSLEVSERVVAAGELAGPSAPIAALTGSLVLARYSDGCWYRARVLAPPQHDMVSVLFVDYGNRDDVGAAELRTLPEELARHPGQALPVRLSGVQMTAELAVRLTEMVPMDGTRVVLRVTALPLTGPPEVEAYKRLDTNELVSINATLLISSSRPDSVSRQSSVSESRAAAAATARAPAPAPAPAPEPAPRAATSPSEQLARLSTSELGLPQFRVSQQDGYLDVTVSFCSNPWNIYVQPYLEGNNLRSMMRSMQEYFGQEANIRPLQPGDVASRRICAVRKPEDDIWYRARVETRLDNDQITINFVDYGDFGYVPLEPAHVQPLPDAFRKLPAQAVKARLGGVRPTGSEWTFADCQALQRLLESGVFCAELLQLSSDSITGEQLIVVRLVDTSDPVKDLYVDRLLVAGGHALHTGEYYTS